MSISRNTSYNLIGSIIPLAVSLVSIPIYLDLIGAARYGVLAIAWLLLGYFGLFDLGLGRATAQRIAALKNSSDGKRAEAFWTALSMNMLLGIVGGLIVWPVATYFFGYVFKIEEALRPEVRSSVIWLVLAVPIATLSGVLGGALEGRSRFLELNIISVSGTVLFQLLPLGAAITLGADLNVLIPAAIFARLLTVAMLYRQCQRHVFHGNKFSFAREQSASLLRFGGWVTVTSFVGPMMVVLDRFIIGAMIGAKAVSYYTIPFQLAERVSIVPGALASAIFPRFAGGAQEEQSSIARDGMRALVSVMTPLVVVGLYLMEPFLSWWISPALARQSAVVGQVILLGYWVNSFAKIPYARLQANGRPDLVAKCHLLEVLPYFGLLYLGLKFFGLTGAALAFSLRVLVDYMLLAYLAEMLGSTMRLLWGPGVLLASVFAISTADRSDQSWWWVLVVASLLFTAALSWRASPSVLREFIRSRCRIMISVLTKDLGRK